MCNSAWTIAYICIWKLAEMSFYNFSASRDSTVVTECRSGCGETVAGLDGRTNWITTTCWNCPCFKLFAKFPNTRSEDTARTPPLNQPVLNQSVHTFWNAVAVFWHFEIKNKNQFPSIRGTTFHIRIIKVSQGTFLAKLLFSSKLQHFSTHSKAFVRDYLNERNWFRLLVWK